MRDTTKRWLWFGLIWLASVFSLGIVTYVLRLLLRR